MITAGNTAPTVIVTTPVEGGTFDLRQRHPVHGDGHRPGGRADRLRARSTSRSSSATTRTATPRAARRAAPASCTRSPGTSRTAVNCSASSARRTPTTAARASPAAQHHRPDLDPAQKHQEVEFAVNQSGTNTATDNDGGLSSGGRGNPGVHRGSLAAGDWIQLNGPFNLLNINSHHLPRRLTRQPARPGHRWQRSRFTRTPLPARSWLPTTWSRRAMRQRGRARTSRSR